jgi:hypothetical protein
MVTSVALIGLIAFSSGDVPQAAFTARVYLPGKARSTYDVYLWRGPGQPAERLTNSKAICTDVRWVARDELQWVESGPTRYNQWAPRRDAQMRRVVLNLRTWRRTVSAPGEQLKPPNVLGRALVQAPVELSNADDPYSIWEEALSTRRDGYASDAHWKKEGGFEIPDDDRVIPWPNVPDSSNQYPRLQISGTGDLHYGVGYESFNAGTFGTIYRFGDNLADPEVLIHYAAQFEFHPKIAFYCARTEEKMIDEYESGKFEWANEGWVGNWKTGQRWDVMPKAANLTSISLRPRLVGQR